jgi:heme/copper-type cytochrome/quinol oxidase subunit 3
MSDTAITSTEALPSGESHELAPHIKVARARAGVLLFILSDAMMVAAIMAAGGYLNALNTFGQFKVSTDQPAFAPGLVVAIILVLSGLCYLLWARGARQGSGQQFLFLLALLLMIAALVAQIWTWVSLGYTTAPDEAPVYDAFQSMVLLVTGFAAFHLLVTALVGILLGGRIMRGRLAGHEYIAQAVGYWWYYVVISTVLIWLFIVLL